MTDKKPEEKPPAQADRSDKFVWKVGDLVVEKAPVESDKKVRKKPKDR
jgi:hypothetical protein